MRITNTNRTICVRYKYIGREAENNYISRTRKIVSWYRI